MSEAPAIPYDKVGIEVGRSAGGLCVVVGGVLDTTSVYKPDNSDITYVSATIKYMGGAVKVPFPHAEDETFQKLKRMDPGTRVLLAGPGEYHAQSKSVKPVRRTVDGNSWHLIAEFRSKAAA
ncbi:MAG: hypothetical protein AAF937_00550 [Planctomycetota bacterium]